MISKADTMSDDNISNFQRYKMMKQGINAVLIDNKTLELNRLKALKAKLDQERDRENKIDSAFSEN